MRLQANAAPEDALSGSVDQQKPRRGVDAAPARKRDIALGGSSRAVVVAQTTGMDLDNSPPATHAQFGAYALVAYAGA
jgi:hypothetical protein